MMAERLLLTGFGPFPGAAENPSAWLADSLAARLRKTARGFDILSHTFATEWNTVASSAPSLLECFQPDIVLQFGLSKRAAGFVIERAACNACATRADAAGAPPLANAILAHGPARLQSFLPAYSLASHLRRMGFPARASADAGRYLCNFLYYLSLDWAARRMGQPLIAFVHIPAPRSVGGLQESDLLAGAVAIADFALRCKRRRLAAQASERLAQSA